MRKWLILLSTLGATGAVAAPAWTWVDNNGQVHYSDRPVPGAKQIELAGAQTFGPGPRASAPPAPADARASTQAPSAALPYRVFNVVSPSQQETLWNIGAMLNVQLAIEPALQPGHQIDVFLDGERREIDATGAEFTVPDVYRGVHTLQAVIVDASGNEVLRSLATTFMVQQTSILNPNSLPGQRRRQGGN